jgi:hypothetical protein
VQPHEEEDEQTHEEEEVEAHEEEEEVGIDAEADDDTTEAPIVRRRVWHPDLKDKAGCISYMRQEDNIYNNRVYRDKCHKTSEYLLHSGRLITK